ncbi:hypothetical protein SDC9_84134 [bioreactor metagenome]|uniref:Uncharacterized protein n=1 Tax=bioreactor metagenome TaxID=1076179 RepID=A0A644Z9F6_9ZZZZ
MALRLIILCTPIARATVTIAGSPSGIAATAKLIPDIHIKKRDSPFATPVATTIKQITKQPQTNQRPRCSSRFSKGVGSCSSD